MEPPEECSHQNSLSHDENSCEGLQIVLESPRSKKKANKELNESDKEIIKSVEQDLEDNLEEKAAKANLTTHNVKNILKHVVTNEHVLALVRAAVNPEDNDQPIAVYEPKFTRAKTKELLSNVPNVMPWPPPAKKKTTSEVAALMSEELPEEDSSGDEYVPDEHNKTLDTTIEEDNINNISIFSENDKFISRKSVKSEDTNVALRTRSKLCLSHTPLEVIEESFMPPDITTDMYDMDCDDDVWKDFLKKFTRPLDEVTKAAEDEDHDPEYNILADEEIDQVDKEELRADRAVTVSRKELNALMHELFEYADLCQSNQLNGTVHSKELLNNQDMSENIPDAGNPVTEDKESDSENQNVVITKNQIMILEQQMRQHVQMLTQNFLLTYNNPEFDEMAVKFKTWLTELKSGAEGKIGSVFETVNLEGALKLIEDWEKLFADNRIKVQETKLHFEKVIAESIAAKMAGLSYICTFPPFLMETISKSKVFLYPSLLPRIPFRSTNVTRTRYYYFTHQENNLIAVWLDQLIPQLKQDSFHINKFHRINMKHVVDYIHKGGMPHISPAKIERHISEKRQSNAAENPIKYFFNYKKPPPFVHYVSEFNRERMLAPCDVGYNSLPHLWREHIYPEQFKKDQGSQSNNVTSSTIIISGVTPVHVYPVTKVNRPPVYNINFAKKFSKRKRQSKSTRNAVFKRPRSKILEVCVKVADLDMLPDMPSLGTTPVKNSDKAQSQNESTKVTSTTNEKPELNFQNIQEFGFKFYKPESSVKRNFQEIAEFSSGGASTSGNDFRVSSSSAEKDNLDDINELMIASSTVKNVTKKEPSGAEKKRAKLRREFLANLQMATPDDPEIDLQKEESFAESYYEKLRDNLEPEDYNRLMDILGHYDENTGNVVDLYKNVQSILLPKYKEISVEFLLFLTDIQAHMVGQLMPYFFIKDMARFVKKLQAYFKDQPSQMRKIIKVITDLAERPDITMENVKSTVLPLLKGNVALTDWFLQIFPCEKPPRILSSGPHEVVDITKELSRPPEEEIYETITVPDTEDPYGGATCICACHNVESPQFKSRLTHCPKCGLKFLQGKIYIQTGKALRPAVVSFLTNPEKDHTKRLSAAHNPRKRSDNSPSKQVSPNKDSHPHEENRHSNESEEDCDGNKKKSRKRQRKRKLKTTAKEATKTKTENKTAKAPKNANKKRQRKKSVSPAKKNVAEEEGAKEQSKLDSAVGQLKRPAEDSLETEFCAGPTEFVELKVSSDHSGESGSEIFDTSQEITNTESDDELVSPDVSPVRQADASGASSWTREEDKIILQAFKQRSDSDETFKDISKVLENRSPAEIKNRFHKLMSLLQEMTAKSPS